MPDADPSEGRPWTAPPPPEDRPPPRRVPFWPFLLGGLLAYEISADPALGIVMACLKFGLEDWRTGFWVRLHEPHRRRGLAVFWTAAACGLLKVGMAAVAGWFVLIAGFFLAFVLGIPGIVLVDQFFAVIHLLAAIAWPFVGVCLLATAATLHAGVPIWYGADTRRAHRRRVWPPSVPHPKRPDSWVENQVTLPMLAWPTVAILGFFLLVPGTIDAFNRLSQATTPLVRLLAVLGVMALFFGTLILAGPRVRRAVAQDPPQGWAGPGA